MDHATPLPFLRETLLFLVLAGILIPLLQRFRTSEPVAYWSSEFVIISAFATTGEWWTPDQNEDATPPRVEAADARRLACTAHRLLPCNRTR